MFLVVVLIFGVVCVALPTSKNGTECINKCALGTRLYGASDDVTDLASADEHRANSESDACEWVASFVMCLKSCPSSRLNAVVREITQLAQKECSASVSEEQRERAINRNRTAALSPQCAVKKEPKVQENAVLYQLYTPTFRDSDGDDVGDFKGVQEKINDLRRIGVNFIWPRPVVQTSRDDFDPAAVVDHLRVDPRFGSEEDIKELIRATQSAGLYFIADLPLTAVTTHDWARPGNTLNTMSDAALLDINVPAIRNGLVKAASKYFEWGVDGLHLSKAGLAQGKRKNGAEVIERLASRIRKISANYPQFVDKDVMIFADSVHRGDNAVVNSSVDYFMHSLIDGDKCNGAKILNCLEAAIKEGVGYIESKDAVPPLWNVADLDLARVDEKFASSEYQEEASSLVTLVQLFLPGPVSVFYGEELALPSNPNGAYRQRGLMRWTYDNGTRDFGFSSVNGTHFFESVDDTTGASVNFQSEYSDKLSALTAFRLLSNLRFRDEVFQEGNFTSLKKDGLHVYKRFVDNPLEKVYLLVLNWPEAGESPLAKTLKVDVDLVNGRSLTDVDVVVPSARNYDYFEGQTIKDLAAEKLTLKPYQGVVLRFKP